MSGKGKTGAGRDEKTPRNLQILVVFVCVGVCCCCGLGCCVVFVGEVRGLCHGGDSFTESRDLLVRFWARHLNHRRVPPLIAWQAGQDGVNDAGSIAGGFQADRVAILLPLPNTILLLFSPVAPSAQSRCRPLRSFSGVAVAQR